MMGEDETRRDERRGEEGVKEWKLHDMEGEMKGEEGLVV